MCFLSSLAEEFLLEDIKSYRYMSHGAVPVPGVDDTEQYRQLMEAMDIMAFTPEEQNAIFRTISAVLLFGNMQFKQERNSDQATLPDNTGKTRIACHGNTVCITGHLWGESTSDWWIPLTKGK